MFNIREPKRFEHKYIYYDERKEKLARMELNAKRELGMIAPQDEPYNPEKIRGEFVKNTKHLKRRVESGGSSISTPAIVIALVFMILLIKYLFSGTFF